MDNKETFHEYSLIEYTSELHNYTSNCDNELDYINSGLTYEDLNE